MGCGPRGIRKSFARNRPGGKEAYLKDHDESLSSYRSEVDDYLQDRLTNEINQKDVDKINARKAEILKTLKEDFDAEDISTGGSYSKHTYVNGMSDIDILIKLGVYSDSSIPNKEDSKEVLKNIAERLRQKYPRTEIEVGKMAITLKFSDGTEIQVLPAFSRYNGYKIPDPDSNGWTPSNPERFKRKLTEVNQENGGKVKPIIKLAKDVLNKNNVPIKSYHLENIAVEAFENYPGGRSYSEMLIYLLKAAEKKVKRKMPDETGQSEYVDEYLGNKGSKKRLELSRKIRNVKEKLSDASSKEEWESAYNGE